MNKGFLNFALSMVTSLAILVGIFYVSSLLNKGIFVSNEEPVAVVTNYDECADAGGETEGTMCIIKGKEFDAVAEEDSSLENLLRESITLQKNLIQSDIEQEYLDRAARAEQESEAEQQSGVLGDIFNNGISASASDSDGLPSTEIVIEETEQEPEVVVDERLFNENGIPTQTEFNQVVTVALGTESNVRSQPCGDVILGSVALDGFSRGSVVSPSQLVPGCVLGVVDWIQIDWGNGLVGWVGSDFITEG